MKKSRWIAFMAAANLFAAAFAPGVPAENITIIGTEESEIETEAEDAAGMPGKPQARMIMQTRRERPVPRSSL